MWILAHRNCSAGSAGETDGIFDLCEVFESESKNAVDAAADAQALGAFVTAGESKGITALLEDRETDFFITVGAAVAAATAGLSKDITALLEDRESDPSMTDGDAVALATAGVSGNLGLQSMIEPMILSTIMPTYSLSFNEMTIFRNSILSGTEFYCP